MTSPTPEAIEAGAWAICRYLTGKPCLRCPAYEPDPVEGELVTRGCRMHAKEVFGVAITAYHAHLRANGLKVTSRVATGKMLLSAESLGIADADLKKSMERVWKDMHDAAPEVMG